MSHRVFVIAEAGIDRRSALEGAVRLVDAAAEAGADAVKFRTFADPENGAAASQAAPAQAEMLRRIAVPREWHRELKSYAESREILFLSTPSDLDSLAFLVRSIDIAAIKLGSGDLTNAPLLLAAGATEKPVILSTGMADLPEVEQALGVLAAGMLGETDLGAERFAAAYASAAGRAALAARVTLLHCVSEFPAPREEVNLRAMDTLAARFGLPVGYSDHSRGTAIAIAAAGRGAVMIEKQFTLDRTLPAPDHMASLEPAELAQMIVTIRQIEPALGDGEKRPTPGETANRSFARKSLVAARAIKAGEPFTPDNLSVAYPGSGRSPFDYWSLLGHAAQRDYEADEVIE